MRNPKIDYMKIKTTLLTIVISLFFIGSVKTQTHPITISPNQRVVSLQMTSSEYSSWKSKDDFSNDAKRQALIQDIYQKFEDKFDFIFLILNETTQPYNLKYAGRATSTSNDITGIGLPISNSDALYCSAGRLKGVIALPQKDYLEYGPSLHELAHSWANKLIYTMDWNGSSEVDAMPHWGFTGGNTQGQLGGFQQNTLQTNIGGNPNKYRVGDFGGYANYGNSVPYSDLELYLMGMIPLTDVANFDVFSGLTQVTYGSSTIEFTASKRTTYDNAKILADAGGPRNPSSETSQKNFRLLVVILTPTPLTTAEWTTLDDQSERFGRSSDDGTSGYNFWEATRGKGTMETGNLLNAVKTSQISAPTITASGPTTFCNGASVSLSTTSNEHLQWYKDGNPIEGATSQTYIATQSGNYSLKAGVGICSVESLSATLVTVTSDIPIPLITSSGPTSICQGGSVILSANSAGPYSYIWSNGLTSQSIPVTSSGNYSVKFTNNNGCTSFPSNSIPVLVGNMGTWTKKADFGGQWREDVVGFSIGTKVYIVTGNGDSYKKDLWEYDTSTDRWTQKTSFKGTARVDAIGFSIGSKGYVGLGYDVSSVKKDFWEYNPSNDTWTQKANFGGTARWGAVGFSIGSKGYVGTGNSGTLQRDFWEYNPVSNTWTQKTSFGGTARHSAVGFSIGSKGYLGTGIDGIYKKDFWEYDPENDTWTRKTDFGGVPRYKAVGFSIGSNGYVGTGYDGSYYKDFWEYVPISNTWSQKADFGGTARSGAVGISIETAGYVGTGANNFYEKDFWEYKIKTPTITANGETAFCSGGSVILTSSSATSYLWSNDATTQSITVSTSGTYFVTTNDGSGCLATSSAIPVIVNDLPANAGTISGTTTVFQGQNSVNYIVPSIPNATSYIWTLPIGATGISFINSITVNYSNSAISGNITVKGHNSCGDGAVNSLTIIVNPLPDSAGTITGIISVCPGQNSVSYTVPTIANAISYIWTLPVGATGSSTTNSITVDYGTSAISGNIEVKGHNDYGDGAESILAITVNAAPPTPKVGAISQPTCSLATGSVALSGLPATGTWTITRTPGGITSTGTGTTTILTGLTAGTYTFTVTNASGCTSVASANAVINAQPVTPSAPVIGTIIQPTCALATGSIALNGLPASGTWTLKRTPGGTTTTGTGINKTITGLAAGTYTFTATNLVGCTSVASANAVINVQPVTPTKPFIGTITQPTCALSTGSIALNGLPATGIWTLTRTPGGITSSGTGTTTTVPGLDAGTYIFTLTNADGCTSVASANAAINAQPVTPTAPVIGTITQPTCALSTGSVALSGLPATGTWTLTRTPGGTTTTGTGTNKTITGLAAGTYTFTATNAVGCTSVESANVVINAQPATPDVTDQTVSILTGGTFTVTPNGVPSGIRYTWTIPTYAGGVTGGIAQTNSQSNISGSLTIPSGTGTATYTVTPTSGSCVGATFTITVTVTSSCVAVAIGNHPTDKNMCASSGNETFTVGATGTAPFIYQWQYNKAGTWTPVANGIPMGASYTNATTETLSVTGITTAGSTQYRCYITNCSSGNNATSNAAILTVNAPPTAPTVSTLITNVLHSDAINGNQWYNKDGLIAGATTQNYTPKSSGDYYVVVSVNGCTSIASNTLNYIVTGIEPIEFTKSMKVYPNPVTNELTIELEGNATKTNFEVLNSVGQVVFNGSLIEKTIVQTASFAPGVYLIKLESEKMFEFKKIIKNR